MLPNLPPPTDHRCDQACHAVWDWSAFPELFPNPERVPRLGDRGCTPERPCLPSVDVDSFLGNLFSGTLFDTSGVANPFSGTIFDTSPSPAADPFAGTIFETIPSGGGFSFDKWLRKLLKN